MGRYDVADTVFRGDRTIFETKRGAMTVYARHLLITYTSPVGSTKTAWSLFTDLPGTGNVSEFSAVEQWRYTDRPGQPDVQQGPWTFRKVNP